MGQSCGTQVCLSDVGPGPKVLERFGWGALSQASAVDQEFSQFEVVEDTKEI